MKIVFSEKKPGSISTDKIISNLVQLCNRKNIFGRNERAEEIKKEIDSVVLLYKEKLDKLNKVQELSSKMSEHLKQITNKNEDERERLIKELGSEL